MSDFNFNEKSPASSKTDTSASKDGISRRSQDAVIPSRKCGSDFSSSDTTDSVNDSDTVADMIEKIHNLPEVRYELVDRIRYEIGEGTYETSEKLDMAIITMQEDFLE